MSRKTTSRFYGFYGTTPTAVKRIIARRRRAFYGFYGFYGNSEGGVRDAPARARPHPLAPVVDTSPTVAVKSVKSVKPPAPSCGFGFTPPTLTGVNAVKSDRRFTAGGEQ